MMHRTVGLVALAAMTLPGGCASRPSAPVASPTPTAISSAPAEATGSAPEDAMATSGAGTEATVRTHEPSPPGEATKHVADCTKDVAAACHAAALDAYYKPSSAATDRAAVELFTKACAAGYAPSCNGLGLLHTEGRGVTKDLARAAQLFRDSCVAGASTGCEHLADALHRGAGVAKDEAAAERAMARKKCAFEVSLKKGTLAGCPPL